MLIYAFFVSPILGLAFLCTVIQIYLFLFNTLQYKKQYSKYILKLNGHFQEHEIKQRAYFGGVIWL